MKWALLCLLQNRGMCPRFQFLLKMTKQHQKIPFAIKSHFETLLLLIRFAFRKLCAIYFVTSCGSPGRLLKYTIYSKVKNAKRNKSSKDTYPSPEPTANEEHELRHAFYRISMDTRCALSLFQPIKSTQFLLPSNEIISIVVNSQSNILNCSYQSIM